MTNRKKNEEVYRKQKLDISVFRCVYQRCPSRLKNCRCRAATLEKKSYRDATAYKNILPRRDGL